jgi:hypothetical protein
LKKTGQFFWAGGGLTAPAQFWQGFVVLMAGLTSDEEGAHPPGISNVIHIIHFFL